jgi:hypothetical protein
MNSITIPYGSGASSVTVSTDGSRLRAASGDVVYGYPDHLATLHELLQAIAKGNPLSNVQEHDGLPWYFTVPHRDRHWGLTISRLDTGLMFYCPEYGACIDITDSLENLEKVFRCCREGLPMDQIGLDGLTLRPREVLASVYRATCSESIKDC